VFRVEWGGSKLEVVWVERGGSAGVQFGLVGDASVEGEGPRGCFTEGEGQRGFTGGAFYRRGSAGGKFGLECRRAASPTASPEPKIQPALI